jgi:hypothetical protein
MNPMHGKTRLMFVYFAITFTVISCFFAWNVILPSTVAWVMMMMMILIVYFGLCAMLPIVWRLEQDVWRSEQDLHFTILTLEPAIPVSVVLASIGIETVAGV